MTEELGKIEKPPVEKYRTGRKLFFTPLIFTPKEPQADFLTLVNRYWSQVEAQVSNLETTLSKVNKKLTQMDRTFPMVLDSIAGGQLLVLKLSEIENRIPLDGVGALLNQTLGIIKRRTKKWIKPPAGYEWLNSIKGWEYLNSPGCYEISYDQSNRIFMSYIGP